MTKKYGIFAAGVLIAAFLCTHLFAAETGIEEIRIGGGGAAINTVIIPAADMFQELNSIRLTINVSTPVKGLIELNNGLLDASVGAIPFDRIIAGAAKSGVILDPAKFAHVTLGINKTVVFTNKDANVTKLSKEQLKGIFSGKITNWKQVGGRDKNITVLWGTSTPGQNSVFENIIMDGQAVTAKALRVGDYFDIRNKAAEMPGAVGIDPAMFINDTIAFPEVPEMSSPIVIITKKNTTQNIDKLVKFLREIADSLN